jgi:hypothetical protein
MTRLTSPFPISPDEPVIAMCIEVEIESDGKRETGQTLRLTDYSMHTATLHADY